jgi:hypothetical protein
MMGILDATYAIERGGNPKVKRQMSKENQKTKGSKDFETICSL